MGQKKPIKIKTLSRLKSNNTHDKDIPDEIADKWVKNQHNISSSKLDHLSEDMSRFTIVIPNDLHKRIKQYCVVHSVSMKDKISAILNTSFPKE